MRNYFLKIFYALLLMLLLQISGSTLGFNWQTKRAGSKCIESERLALLKFKQGIVEFSDMLSLWKVDDENNGDCCKWKGIECDNETGHVQMLDLGGHDLQFLIGPINITALIDLKNIEYLDLSYNYFPFSHIPELIGSFTNLRYLNLSNTAFVGRIPYQLGNLSKLEYLDLGQNPHLYGAIPFQIGNLRQLRYLDIGEASLSGAIPFQIGKLPILHTLRLGGNFDVETKDAEWLSTLYYLTNLELRSFQNIGSSYQWLQMISKHIPNLQELRLVDCGLLDNNIPTLFDTHSNFSTSLTILDLSYNMLTSSTFGLLSNFPSLVVLDLSYNNMRSSIFWGNFNFSFKLQELYLTNCSLMDRSFLVPSTFVMNSSSSLVTLDLSHNLLKSSTIFHWLFNSTTNLQSLNLFANMLEGPIPNGFGKVMNSLKYLNISHNKMQGNIPTFFGNMCTLQILDLSHNNLSGEMSSFIQNSSWCNKHIFQILFLSYNWISGMLPKSIRMLYELEYLDLEGNLLEGDVTESHLSNLTKLKEVSLSYNSLSLKFVSNWVPPFQLVLLQLASCKLGSRFPNWLQTQSSLFWLDISNAGLNDSVPEWFWNNSQYMIVLNMSHNNLKGAIPNLPLKFPYAPTIALNSNQFEGRVPSFLLQASRLILSENKFSNLFSFLCGKSKVANFATLDLSNNQIKGQLPDCWKTVNTLLFLDLRNNKLSGKIPPSMGTLVKLEALVLQNNSLMGELPSTLKNCKNLFLLDVGENLLSGQIPSWIGENMQELIILSMKGNNFSGNIPNQLCYLRRVQLLDLSRNSLSKGIPTCFINFTTMSGKSINSSEIESHIFWYNNTYYELYYGIIIYEYVFNITFMWKGTEHWFKNPELSRISIDLSSNNLTGEIPKEVGYLLGLVSLNLSRNNLRGEIPSEIGNLISLEFLDLSSNHLSGKIPSALAKIDRLAMLDLSNNSLSGRIPWGRQLQTFDASSFEGNPNLCGKSINKTCPEDEAVVEPQGPVIHCEDESSLFYEALYMSLGIGYFTGFWGLLGPILLWRAWRNVYLRFLNRLTDYICGMVVVNVTKFHWGLKG